MLPGEVLSQWQYDSTGRPTNHRVSSQSRFTRRRAYQWGANHRLKGIVNEVTGVRTAFGYDEFSNLVWSNEGGPFDFLHRSVDEVGNLYETKDKKDRVYGAGSRLLETADATFSYDEEGNLIQKVEKKNGATWQYAYYGNGMLAKVINPDHTAVTFKYDALGRRVEKRSNEKTTMFIWDGNTIFHEYFSVDDSEKLEDVSENSPQHNPEQPANLVTWVFNDGFVPSAKLTNEGNYSIISDYLGTPVEAYDEQGKKVWSAALDIYGRVQEFTGEQDFIPFRYQGQYEDVEIGLYYNRFRYYDPAQGNYTQVDPIGLAGGNPTLYGYVRNINNQVDIYGLRVINNPLLSGEGKVGTFEYLISKGFKNDNLTPHHMPSALFMLQYGVSQADGVTMNMEQPSPGKGGRHRATASYGMRRNSSFNQLYLSLSPREALAFDIRDARKIYQEGGKYTPEIRRGLQNTIALNKTLQKEMFRKNTKCKG